MSRIGKIDKCLSPSNRYRTWLIKYLLLIRGVSLKEIGEFLKKSRISNCVSIEEAAEDLNLSVIQLENIEDGNIRAFKDMYALRDLVKDYGKYLGLETDNIISEFNDFMFEHTSKISLDDIMEAKKIAKEKELEEKTRIASPYTVIRTPKFSFEKLKLKPILIIIGVIIFLFIVFFIWLKVNDNNEVISSELMGNNMEDVYEFTY